MTHARKALVVCASVHHGNTARVAREIADVLGSECVSPEGCSYEQLADVELLGLGSGVYYGRMHDTLRRWVLGMPEGHARRLRAFIFTTSGLPLLANLWHRPLRRILTSKGCRVSGEFSCRGYDTWGPLWLAGGLNRMHPDPRDLERARAFAAQIAQPGSEPKASLTREDLL